MIVISDAVWRQDFGGAPSVIGHQIALDGELVTVIGVMPRGFFFPTPEIRAWRPLQLDPANTMYKVGYLTLVASAKPGASPALVNGDVQRIAKLLGARFTYSDAEDKTRGAHAIPIRTYLLGDVRTPLLLLLGAVALLFLIACANAAALILARTTDRAGEMAVRTALGAGAGRLARQILAESLVLALCAAIMGALLASAGFRLLVARLPLQSGFGSTVAIGWISFATAFALALIIALVVSIVPIRHLLRGGRELGVNRERSDAGLRHGVRRVHDAIIAAQVTLAVLLVVGATLLIRTVEQIRDIDPGFDVRGVTTYNLVPPSGMPAAVAASILSRRACSCYGTAGREASGHDEPLTAAGPRIPAHGHGRGPSRISPERNARTACIAPRSPGSSRPWGCVLLPGAASIPPTRADRPLSSSTSRSRGACGPGAARLASTSRSTGGRSR